MKDFIGSEHARVDEKGRFAIPVRFRKQLDAEDEETFVLMPGMDEELMAFPLSTWRDLRGSLEKPNPFDANQRMINRRFFNESEPCKLDGQGRISIPAPMREKYEIDGTVLVTGSQSWLDIWSEAKYRAVRQRDDEEAVKVAGRIKLSHPPTSSEG